MIRYALVCEAGHAFEAWFASSGAFAEQQQAGQVACAVCGSSQVGKALMAPSLTSGREAPQEAPAAAEPAAEAAAPDTEASTAGKNAAPPVTVAAHTDKREELVGLLRKLRRHVTENAEYVGKRFPEEARKIHYGETDKRGIYGEASAQEARELADEGIEFHPLPVLPEERN
jgi:hypothetical protein